MSRHVLIRCLFVLLSVCGSQAWTCQLTVVGGNAPAEFADCSVRCEPGASEDHANLTALADPSLSNCQDISGVSLVFTPPQATHQPALITFAGVSNLTLEHSQLLDINFTQLASIISFVNATNITITNLTSSGCTVNQVLTFTSLAIESSQVVVQSSHFSALLSGAINATYTDLTVRDTVFDNTHAASNNTVLGLLHTNNTDGSALTIHNCTFSDLQFDNLHPNAVIYARRPSVTITDSTFSNCSTQYAIVSVYAWALINGSYLSNETVTIDRCVFINNSADQGILYQLGKDSNPSQELHLYNSQFIGNTAAEGSGVTAFAVGVIRVVACEFRDNWSSNGVSSFYVYGWVEQVTYFTMHDSIFSGNNGTRTSLVDNEGAGIIDIAECGGVYLSSCKCIGIMNTTFDSNIGIGACVHGQQGSSPDCALSDPVFFSQSTIAGPEAEPFLDNFLGFYDDLVITLDIRDSQFTSNTDAFLVREEPEPAQVQPIDFLTGGAGLDIQDVLFTVLSGNTFSSNRGRQGSALHLDTALTTYVYNCSFDNNTATGQGGAIALVNSHSKGLLLANSSISNSHALFGGAVYGAAGAQITISNSSQLVSNHAVSDGGAVYCQSCQQLTLERQAKLSSNTAGGSGGAVFCDGCIVLQAHAAHFTLNSAGGGGAIGSSGNGYTLTNISHSLFQGNTALQTTISPSDSSMLQGGAVSVAGGVSLLVSNMFLDNKAGMYGGAVAYQDQCFTVYDTTGVSLESFLWAQLAPNLAAMAGNCSYFISTANIFSGNHANIAGAVIFSTNLSSMQLKCAADSAFQNSGSDCAYWTSTDSPANTVGAEGIVGYGTGLAFPPAKVVFRGSADAINYISDGSSDVPVPLVTVLDQAGNTVKMQPLLANVTVAAVSKGSDGSLPQLPGQTQASGDANGTIAIEDVVLIAQTGVYDLLVALPDFPEVPAAVLQVHVQPCGMGQVPNSDQTQCTLCPSSSYSFDPAVKDCKACPSGATCIGGATLVPQQQFWHSAPDSDHIVACPNNNACAGDTAALLACQNATYSANLDVNQAPASVSSSCLLDEPWTSSNPESYMRQLCTPGYYGPVCSLCVTSGNKTYGRVGTLQCKPCRSRGAILSAYVASALLVLAWLSFTIHVTLVENEEAAAGQDESQRTSQLIRALNLWLQYLTLLGGINIPSPKSVHWIFAAASFVFATVTSGSLSTDCLLSGPINTALQRMLIHLAVPGLMFIALSCIQLLRWWKMHSRTQAITAASPYTVQSLASPPQHLSSSSELQRRLLITLLEVLFFYYPSLLTTTLNLFDCFHIDPSGASNAQYHNAQATWHYGYWVPDMSIECFTGWHRKVAIILGTPLMTLTWVFIPLLPAYLLFKHRRNLNAPRVQLQLGYIYRDYRPQLWFWNSVVLVMTLALAASQVFATALDTYFQLTIMLMILIVGVTAFAHFRPFMDDLLQNMQVLGLFIVLATAAGCLCFLDPTNIANSGGLEAVGIVLLVLNSGYIIVMLVLIAVTGAPKTKRFTCSAVAMVKTTSSKFKRSVSGLSSASSRSTSRQDMAEVTEPS